MARFRFVPTPLQGLFGAERMRLQDARGFLARLYCQEEFAAAGCALSIAQINHTLTRNQGALRGMHFQRPPHAEIKLVSCVRGEVFDVAVDLRAGSPTFLQWHAQILSPENGMALFIPQGFAHGFQAMREDCELVYLHSTSYHPESEGALNALDPKLAIEWPLPVGEMSERDRGHAFLTTDFSGITL